MVVMVTADGLREVLDVGELTAFGGARKVGGQLVELRRRCGIAVRLCGLRRGLQVGRNLLSNLLVLRRVRLLKLLERAHQLGKRRKTTAV